MHFPGLFVDSERVMSLTCSLCKLSLCCRDTLVCSAVQPNENESKSFRRDDH